jgi:hypothetical protein
MDTALLKFVTTDIRVRIITITIYVTFHAPNDTFKSGNHELTAEPMTFSGYTKLIMPLSGGSNFQILLHSKSGPLINFSLKVNTNKALS